MIHATIDPPELLDPERGSLTLRFDAPKAARGVRVQLVELDKGIPGEGGADDIIAIFDGNIANKRFKGKLIRQAMLPPGAPSFNFQFEGDATPYHLNIPSGRGEDERGTEARGAYEIGVKVTKAKPVESYSSGVLTYIRNLPQADRVADQRPVMTFLTKAKDNSGFYQSAARFWEPPSDRMIVASSLEEVIAFLNRPRGRTKDGMDFGPWGEVNIVSHGAEEGYAQIKLFKRSQQWGIDAKSLTDHQHDPRLRITTLDIDDGTTVVWRGCLVGKSAEFLQATRTIFGGRCTVYGPRYVQGYRFVQVGQVTHAWEYFEENFYFDVPWKPAPAASGAAPWKRPPKLPPPRQIAARLAADHPGAATDEEWLQLVKSKKSRHDSRPGHPKTYLFDQPFARDDVPNRREAHRIARAAVQRELRGAYDEYYWRITGPRLRNMNGAVDGLYHCLCKGTKYRIEVRRVLRDGQGGHGDVVVPNLRNPVRPNDYGHLP